MSRFNKLCNHASRQIRHLCDKKGFVDPGIVTMWSDIIDGIPTGTCIPDKVVFSPKSFGRSGELFIRVPDGATAVEVTHSKSAIVDSVNTFCGYKLISSLRVIQDAHYKENASISSEGDIYVSCFAPNGLRNVWFESVSSTIDCIKSNELKSSLQGMLEDFCRAKGFYKV